jgi:hypothetical protein
VQPDPARSEFHITSESDHFVSLSFRDRFRRIRLLFAFLDVLRGVSQLYPFCIDLERLIGQSSRIRRICATFSRTSSSSTRAQGQQPKSLPEINPDDGNLAPEVLKAAVRANQNNVGVYGTVTRIGRLAVGQTIVLHQSEIP